MSATWHALVVAACCALGGCILITNRDLHIVEDGPARIVTSGDTATEGWAQPASGDGLLAATFSADHDLKAYSAHYENSLWVQASICTYGRFDESKLVDDDPYFRDAGGHFHHWHEPLAGDPPGVWRYRIYVGLVRHVVSQDLTPSFDYDLRADPQDVCFRVRGAEMLGRRYISNTIRVSRDAVAAAVAQAGHP